MHSGLPTRAPSGRGSGNRPRARHPTHRSRSPAPPSPGAGSPAAAACPRAVRDGATKCRAAAGREKQRRARRAGGRGAPPFELQLRRARSPRKVWRSEGWRRGGRRGRFPALPRPAPGVRPFPRESAPHRRGTDRALLQMPCCLGPIPGGCLEETEVTKRPLSSRALQSHTSELCIKALSFCPSLLTQWGQIYLKRQQRRAAHTHPSLTPVESRLTSKSKACSKA